MSRRLIQAFAMSRRLPRSGGCHVARAGCTSGPIKLHNEAADTHDQDKESHPFSQHPIDGSWRHRNPANFALLANLAWLSCLDCTGLEFRSFAIITCVQTRTQVWGSLDVAVPWTVVERSRVGPLPGCGHVQGAATSWLPTDPKGLNILGPWTF